MADAYTARPLSPLRRAIAARMIESKQSIPHFRVAVDLEVDALMHFRRELRERNPEVSVSLNDVLIKACARALMDVPAVNIQWAGTEIREYRSADVSVVMALEGGGLSTPIIRAAESKSVCELSREVRELGRRAARGALRMDEILGGTFSLSNLGMHGADRFDAIINPPQCAILAVGAATPRVVVTDERTTRIATMMTATLSCDHRAIDGATGAKFLSALKHHIAYPVE